MSQSMQHAREAVQAAESAGADYADARFVELELEELRLHNGALEGARAQAERGLGLRVLVDGAWGFASAAGDEPGAPAELARRAVGSARALAAARTGPIELSPDDLQSGEYRTPVVEDPFALSYADKVDLMVEADKGMQGREEIVSRNVDLGLRRERQWFFATGEVEQFQELVRSGGGIAATAAIGGVVERRSYPAAFGGDSSAAGFEFVRSLDLAQHGTRVRDEAIELCKAPVCEAGERDLLLMGNQLMLQIHESVGHPNELDRVFGHEVDLAGASFATTEKLGEFRYGSDIVNLVADSTAEGGLDTRGWDDDGVASGRWHVVKDGIFQGYHTSREWSHRIGESQSRATNRAEGWYNPPIIRITNLSLMPGTWTLDDMIADTEDGVLCDTVKMWSIDQRRLNFQFTTELGWEIKNGKKHRMVRKPTYQGNTPDFWRSCDAICDEHHWRLWGLSNCGKGNPMQVAEMSHGCSPARFRKQTFVV
ncbi:MAG: TldD/PmbA family protein [Planctomycetota bacterium]|nr:TldD/PmbA family protein [Planctomycetota bacterium]